MGKYIDKMPPSGGDPKQIEDYLAYLKDQLNFIFDNYWRNIKGAVTFESLKEPGKTVIDGGNVVTGKIESENGDFYVDLENGKTRLKHAEILGGRIEIETDDEDESIITLRYVWGSAGLYTLRLTPTGVFISDDQGDYRSTKLQSTGLISQLHNTPVRYANWVGVDGAALGMLLTNAEGKRIRYSETGYELSEYDAQAEEFVKRAEFNVDGLTFYDDAGNVTASYPAVQGGV